MADERKFLFFTCINNEDLYALCTRHIRALAVPEGFTVETGAARGARSMAQAYNRAMAESGAKYKVYLHQDTFIVNPTFLSDVLRLFAANPKIGLLGVAGCQTLPASGVWWEGRNLFGKVLEYRQTFHVLKFAEPAGPFARVQAVDGLIMVTRYDLPWREDLFTGFHLYDTSQSLEFVKAGYRVVVPAQAEPWCLHWCGNDFDTAEYYRYRDIFLEHYREFLP
ncbi:MAG TPA: glycosyltransferase family protein [Spirochaetia bacterium]|nr:glycosyltransferase family protein [Spirochaetia bacterium]